MLLKNYGVFDSVQGEYVRTFTAKNDDEAKRAADYIVREQGFDDIAGKDRSIHYLFSLDTDTGVISDNSVHMVCNLATSIESRKTEQYSVQVRSQVTKKEFLDELKQLVLFEVQKGLDDDGRKGSGKAKVS